MPEFDPETAQAIAQLAAALDNHPDTRAGFRGLVKKLKPQTFVPEVDLPAQVAAAVTPTLQKLDAALDRLQTVERQRAVDDAWAKAGVSPEDRPKVEEFVQTMAGDVALAAQTYRAAQQPAATPRSGPGRVVLPHQSGEEWFKGLAENPSRWAESKAYDIVDGFRSGQIRLGA